MKIEARRPFRHNGFIKKPVYLSADFKRARRLAHAILNGAYPLPPSIQAGLALLVFFNNLHSMLLFFCAFGLFHFQFTEPSFQISGLSEDEKKRRRPLPQAGWVQYIIFIRLYIDCFSNFSIFFFARRL